MTPNSPSQFQSIIVTIQALHHVALAAPPISCCFSPQCLHPHTNTATSRSASESFEPLSSISVKASITHSPPSHLSFIALFPFCARPPINGHSRPLRHSVLPLQDPVAVYWMWQNFRRNLSRNKERQFVRHAHASMLLLLRIGYAAAALAFALITFSHSRFSAPHPRLVRLQLARSFRDEKM
jgi:hypothetical protein